MNANYSRLFLNDYIWKVASWIPRDTDKHKYFQSSTWTVPPGLVHPHPVTCHFTDACANMQGNFRQKSRTKRDSSTHLNMDAGGSLWSKNVIRHFMLVFPSVYRYTSFQFLSYFDDMDHFMSTQLLTVDKGRNHWWGDKGHILMKDRMKYSLHLYFHRVD